MKLTRCIPSSLAGVSDFDQWLRHPLAGFPAFGHLADVGSFFGANAPARLATDVYEDADNFYARFEVPGVKKEDVKLELHERLLTVNVERREKVGETEQTYTLTRSVAVPDTVLADDITAKLEDGLLTVTLPKQEERKPRTISVN
jgi:HSP20 family protein